MQLSVASMLRESAWRSAEKVAAWEGDVAMTYAELWTEARRRATALAELGVEPGQPVALLATNGLDFVTSYYGILAAGGVVVPIPPMLVAPEIAVLLEDCGAELALVEGDLGAEIRSASGSTGTRVIVLRDGGPDDLATRVAGSEPVPDMVPRGPLDPAVIFYTSGTTGRPKGAVLTHLNLTMNCFVNALIANDLSPDDVVLGCLPLFHTFGQTVALNSAFLHGSQIVLQRRFDPVESLDLIERHGVDVIVGVPTMYIALLEALGDRPAPKLRVCISGGAPLPVAVLEEFEERFGCHIQEGYGLSETSPTASANQPAVGLRSGSIGHPIWGVDVEIADAEIEDRVELMPAGERGEIVIRGHCVFDGYLNMPEASEAALIDGWFRTGDIGMKDEDGFRYVVGRKKDMILRGGFNIYPREVEEAMARHPAVAEVAVIGIPHAVHGEEILAVVVADASGPDASGEELIDWTRERVAHHKRPRLVEFVDELPLGPSRKVLKRELRDRFAGSAGA